MPLKRVADQVAFDEAKMKKVNLFETERFFCDVYCLRPGQEQKPHVHAESDKVYHVLTGSVLFRDGEEEIAGCAGDALWCPAGAEHGVRNPGPDDATLLVFMAPHPRPPTTSVLSSELRVLSCGVPAGPLDWMRLGDPQN